MKILLYLSYLLYALGAVLIVAARRHRDPDRVPLGFKDTLHPARWRRVFRDDFGFYMMLTGGSIWIMASVAATVYWFFYA